MNIHPILVHFPIALLSVYSFFELLRFRQFNTKTFFYIKATFVILGSLSLFAALGTGDYGIPTHRDMRDVIRVHENFAYITTLIYCLLAGSYIIQLINEFFVNSIASNLREVWSWIAKLQGKIFVSPVAVLLALAGLVSIMVTGALGGYIAYGQNNDFFTTIIVNLIINK